ncbi:MAG: hypothetical protein NVS9B3_13080 [Gemmatimonadaceae bacterium]
MSRDRVLGAWVRRVAAWYHGRAPLLTCARHRAELRALGVVAADLCTAVQQAGEASGLAIRQWQTVARHAIAERDQARRERDAAIVEVDRLRSTVASLVLQGVRHDGQG